MSNPENASYHYEELLFEQALATSAEIARIDAGLVGDQELHTFLRQVQQYFLTIAQTSINFPLPSHRHRRIEAYETYLSVAGEFLEAYRSSSRTVSS
jgi:hypothetical protein